MASLVLSARLTRVLRRGLSVLLLASLAMLVITSLGRWTRLGEYSEHAARDGEQFDPSLVARTPSVDAMLREATRRAGKPLANLAPDRLMDILYTLAAARFTHSDQARHNLFSSWMVWLASFGLDRIAYIGDSDSLLRHGHSALCGQVAFVLISMARECGLPARLIGIKGHNVMEVWYDNHWHLYDPDLELVPRTETGEVLNLRQMCIDRELVLKYYAKPKGLIDPQSLADMVTARQYIAVEYLPPGDHTQRPAGGIRYHFEQLADWLVWLVPLGGFFSAWLGLTLLPHFGATRARAIIDTGSGLPGLAPDFN